MRAHGGEDVVLVARDDEPNDISRALLRLARSLQEQVVDIHAAVVGRALGRPYRRLRAPAM